MSSPLLPDVNVWMALHHQIHEHHEAALAWFEALDAERTLVFCRQTQMGFFRLLTTDAVMGDEALTQRQCWTLYWHWISGGKATLENEPATVGQAFEQRTMADASSPKEWMDAYLAAFAETAGIQLVTFDHALAAKVKGAVLLG
jgi:toxin-antitoxin system PIN domain toxin